MDDEKITSQHSFILGSQISRLNQNSGVKDSLIMPRLELNIPMPPGVAVPRASQSQPAPIPQTEPAQPAAAQSR